MFKNPDAADALRLTQMKEKKPKGIDGGNKLCDAMFNCDCFLALCQQYSHIHIYIEEDDTSSMRIESFCLRTVLENDGRWILSFVESSYHQFKTRVLNLRFFDRICRAARRRPQVGRICNLSFASILLFILCWQPSAMDNTTAGCSSNRHDVFLQPQNPQFSYVRKLPRCCNVNKVPRSLRHCGLIVKMWFHHPDLIVPISCCVLTSMF